MYGNVKVLSGRVRSPLFLLGIILLLPLWSLAGQEGEELQAAPAQETPTLEEFAPESGPTPSSQSLLAAFLRPPAFRMGLSPNLDGQLNGQLDFTLRWNGALASSFMGSYSGNSYEETEDSDTAEYQAKTFVKNYGAGVTLLEYLFVLPLGERGGLGLGLSLGGSYIGNQESSSGYRSAQGETVYFNRDRTVHRFLPGAFLSFLGGVRQAFRVELTGSYLPLVVILESGSKLYSTYDEAIPYSLFNVCQAVRGGTEIATLGLGIGNFELGVDGLWLFGNYGTRQDIISGNYLTTIETYAPYQMFRFQGTLEYSLDYLQGMIGVTPALQFGSILSWEVFDGNQTQPLIEWQIGIALGG